MSKTIVKKWLVRAEHDRSSAPFAKSTRMLLEKRHMKEMDTSRPILSDDSIVYEYIENEDNDAKQGMRESAQRAQITPIYGFDVVKNLEGKLLTHIEATFTDREQREAHKSLIRTMLWDSYKKLEQESREAFQYSEVVKAETI